MTAGGDLTERVRFDAPTSVSDGFGNTTDGWASGYTCRAQFIYARGGETVMAARLEGRSMFKVRIRQCDAARALTQSHRLVDLRRVAWDDATQQTASAGVYNIREVDAVTDRAWVYVLVESGVAV